MYEARIWVYITHICKPYTCMHICLCRWDLDALRDDLFITYRRRKQTKEERNGERAGQQRQDGEQGQAGDGVDEYGVDLARTKIAIDGVEECGVEDKSKRGGGEAVGNVHAAGSSQKEVKANNLFYLCGAVDGVTDLTVGTCICMCRHTR